MKLTKIALTGVLAGALISSSCESGSEDDMSRSDMSVDTMILNDDNDEDMNSSNSDYYEMEEEQDLMYSDSMNQDGLNSTETSEIVEREEVKLALLPPSISETLKGEKYLSYTFERAFVLEHADGTKTYEVNVKKDGAMSTMVFNDKGIRVDKK
ncbi:hypothetical protein [Brumimicrobium mesophilum]|uniref:hypothetical protein n=1 Tax=Brumimicrobium mesophilum TaxID=392717 RepID=UPI000D14466D|nr:hypothetical protein [Brumimicrobium mesophilum]